MEACGQRWFFLVDDNFAAHPEWARELCRELTPLRRRWIGQIGLHAARDERLLERMVASGCRGVLDDDGAELPPGVNELVRVY
nr:hypothetical protein [Candidatus Anammoximicrobium sp.]